MITLFFNFPAKSYQSGNKIARGIVYKTSSQKFFTALFLQELHKQLPPNFRKFSKTQCLKISYTFFIQKPKKSKYHYPALSDLENLIKNVNDRLQGVIFENDSQIVEISARKVFHDHAGFFVKVEEKIDETE
jgi:Holliday junction resolvase RusA-like endonuclease